jgi:hypothetical protein
MKKFVSGLLIIGFVMGTSIGFTGCAPLQAVGNGIRNIFSSAPVEFICNPTEAQKLDAEKMLKALDAAQAVGVMFFPALGVAQASAVLTTIKNGSCFLIAQLKQAFEAVDAANTTLMKAKGPAGGGGLPDYSTLRVLVK